MKPTNLFLFFTIIVSFYTDLAFSKNFKLNQNCTQTIYGKVLNKQNNTAIQNAMVTLYLDGQDIKIVKVNTKGEYSFKVNCNLNYRIEVSAANYFKTDYKFKTSAQNNSNIQHNFFLENECYQTITGKVINELSKEFIQNSSLTLYLDGEEVETLTTNDEGAYTFTIRCNTNYYIIANKKDYINDIYEFSSSVNENDVINHNFILEPECIQTISGTVLNKITKEPLSAEIKLYLNNVEVETIKVNNDGSYFIQFQCTTNYRIVASKPNYIEDSYYFLTDYIENKQPDYFHIKKDLFLEPNECFQIVLGKVFNKKTNEVISNATVSLHYKNNEITSFQTSYDGAYFFKIKCGLEYEIKAIKESMLTEFVNYKASTIKGESRTLDLFLEGESCNQIVTGTVVNKETGLPIENTQLTLLENNVEVEKVTSGTDGTFTFNIKCEENYKLLANNSDYSSNSISFSTDKTRDSNISKKIELTPLDCNQIVTGTVINKETGLPIENTQLTLLENDLEIERTTSGADGTFTFNIKCEENYKLLANNSDYSSNSISFSTDKTRDSNISKKIELTPLDCNQIVTGTVINKETGLPIENTQLTLLENNVEVEKVTSGTNGTFTFNIKCEENYKLVVNNSDYSSNSILFSTDKTRDSKISKKIELTPLDCNQIVNGTVINKETGLPIENTQLTLLENNVEVEKVSSGTDGTFTFNIKCDENYKLLANNSDYSSNSISFSTDKTRDSKISKKIELTPLDCNQIVTGTVVNKETGLPIENTQLTLLENNVEVGRTTSEPDGTFTFNIKCEESYKLVADSNNDYNSNSVSFTTDKTRNGTKNISLALTKKVCSQTVTGIIRDKISKKPLPNSTISLYQNNKVIDTYTVGNDGVYEFKLNCSSTYKLTVFKNNNLETFRLKTAVENGRTLTLHIDIEPLTCSQYINGVVKENITGNSIPNAKVLLFSQSKKINETLTDSNGSFYFEIECNKSYTVQTEKLNYTKSEKNVISNNTNDYPHNVELVLEPIIEFKIKNGVKYIETKPIVFELDEYEIINDAMVELNKVIFNMNQNPNIKIEVNYHTDSRGPDSYNLELTEKRASATKDYLISKGISPNRIKAKGYGETRLLNNCKNNVKCTEAEHAINRRTEFIVIDK